MNSRGQASIEALFSLIAMIAFAGFVLTAIYCIYARDQLLYVSHEAMVCREFQRPAMCDFKFNRQIEEIVRFGTKRVRIYKTSNSQNVEVKFSLDVPMYNKDLRWTFTNSISLPLSPSENQKTNVALPP